MVERLFRSPAPQRRDPSSETRILLADDHALVRRGLRLILDGEPGLTVVAEAGDGAEAVELVASGGVDLAVLDIAMPRMTGLQAAREISRRELPVRMLMLSMYDNEQYLLAALQAGRHEIAVDHRLEHIARRACSRRGRRRSSSSSPRATRPRRSPTRS